MKKTVYFIFLTLSLCVNSSAQQNNSLKIIKTFSIKSSGGWDYLELSPVNNWLYVSHGKQVNILDKNTGDSIGIIENTTGVHGIAFDKENKKGFTSNGKLNNVTVFDINTNKVLGNVITGQNPDAISYEPYSKKIITCNAKDNNLSVINPITNVVINTIEMGGSPEAAVSDGNGKLFVNLEDKSEIVVVDMKSFNVIDRFSLSPGTAPTGLAYDKKNKILFSGCEKLLMILDAVTGKKIDQINIGNHCDGVVFDESTKTIYTSNGVGTISVIKQDRADKYTLLYDVVTKRGARTIALDSETHQLYLPTAEYDPKELNANGRPKIIDGTFQILVIGKQ